MPIIGRISALCSRGATWKRSKISPGNASAAEQASVAVSSARMRTQVCSRKKSATSVNAWVTGISGRLAMNTRP